MSVQVPYIILFCTILFHSIPFNSILFHSNVVQQEETRGKKWIWFDLDLIWIEIGVLIIIKKE